MLTNRLLSRSRPEYEAWLAWRGFDPKNPPDPLAIPGVTEGIHQIDALEVFPMPVADAQGDYAARLFLHGLRYVSAQALERLAELRAGAALRVERKTLTNTIRTLLPFWMMACSGCAWAMCRLTWPKARHNWYCGKRCFRAKTRSSDQNRVEDIFGNGFVPKAVLLTKVAWRPALFHEVLKPFTKVHNTRTFNLASPKEK